MTREFWKKSWYTGIQASQIVTKTNREFHNLNLQQEQRTNMAIMRTYSNK